MNKVFLVGRLASNPEPFTTKNGINQARLTIASSDNTQKQESYFFPCIAWRNQANFINTYLKKGDLVAIDGKLTRRSYTSKEGKTVWITEVVIDSISSLAKSKSSNESGLTNSNYQKKDNISNNVSIDNAFSESTNNQNNEVEKQKILPNKPEENDGVADDNDSVDWDGQQQGDK